MTTKKAGRSRPMIPKAGVTRRGRKYGCGGKMYKSGGKLKGKCKY